MIFVAEVLVRDFFFKAMQQGWVAGNEGLVIPELPGYKAASFTEGDYHLVDRWSSTPNLPRFAGETTIWFRGNPVWVMHYHGIYKDEANPVIRQALQLAYLTEEFHGGRGVLISELDYLRYFNVPERNEFCNFEGHEEVRLLTGESVGWLKYSGSMLVG